MTHNTQYAQTYSPCLPQEEEGEWVWVPKRAINPTFPITHQSPMYRSSSAGSTTQPTAPTTPWTPSPVTPTYSSGVNDIPILFGGSPTQPLLQGLDFDQVFDMDALLGNVDPRWDVPLPESNLASADLFNRQDANFFSGLDLQQFGLPQEATNPLTPPGGLSPSTPVYGTLGVPNSGSPPLPPLTPASLVTPTTSPASTSPATPAPQQLLSCSDASCTKVFPTRSDLKKHERKHRQPFRCPLPACGKGHLDKRALARHLWAQHPTYAQQSNTRSERVKCPWCAYEGRRDNVRRHAEKKHPGAAGP